MVISVFPEENWNSKLFFRRNKKSRQRVLLFQLKKIFPAEDICEDFLHKQILRISGFPLELDVFLPKLNFAIEFNGEQHYNELASAGFSPLENQLARDQEKVRLCIENGIQLLIIPFWWDNTVESLAETLFQEFPNFSTNAKSRE